MQLGAEAVFVGSGIFMGKRTSCVSCEGGKHSYDDTCCLAPVEQAEKRAKAIVQAATHYRDPKVLLEVSEDLVGAMKGLAISGLDEAQMLQTRGW